MKTINLRLETIWLFLIVILLGTTSITAQTKPWVSAYYAGWELGDGTNGYLPISKVDFTAMSHVIHFALVPNSNGTLNATSNGISTAGASALTTAAHAVGTKVLISIGGWSSEGGFMGATSALVVSTFVSNIVAFVKSNNYDGVDIDWEPLSTSDETQFVAFMKGLRSAIGSSAVITTTAGFDAAAAAAVQNYVDQINIMTYDMSGPWQGWVSWYNSSVSAYGTAATNGSEASANITTDVNNYIAAGVSAAKLGIGSEFAGTVWNGGVMTNGGGVTAPNQAWTTAPTVQEDVPLYAADGSGIMQKYYNPQNYHWDSQAQASYLSMNGSSNSADYFISYEDSNDVNAKFNYIKQSGLGGIIIYSLGMGYPGNGTYPMLALFKRNMGGGTGTLPPADVTPPTVSISSPTNGSTILGTTTVIANASDNVGVTGVVFKVDGTQLGSTLTIAPYSASLVTTSLTNGSHTISATASDAAGNASTASVTVTISNLIGGTKDTTAPTVALSAPSSGASVSGTITLSANATDNVGVTGVQFKVDGANCGGTLTASPYSTTWGTTGVSNGAHTISVTASDAAGNVSTSSVTINVLNAGSQQSAADLVIYQNALSTGWSDGSWGTTANFTNSQPVYPGCTASIRVDQVASGGFRLLSGGWNALVNVDPTQYTNAAFAIYSATSINVSVFLMTDVSGVTFPTVKYGTVTAGQWTNITIPMAQLDPANQPFKMVVIEDVSGNSITYYIDNLRLTALPAPNLASPVSGTANIIDPVALLWAPVGGAQSYRVEVATNQSFSPVVKDTSNVTTDSLVLSGLQSGTTYYWRVNASSSSLTSQWSPVWSFSIAANTTTPSGLSIYQDALQSPWINTSWNATVNFSNTTPLFAGSNSISVVQGIWGGTSLHFGRWNSGTAIDPSSYSALQFEVYATTQSNFAVQLESDQGTSFPNVKYGRVLAKRWVLVTLPLTSLDPSAQTFNRIDILETSGTQKTYYLDNIGLTPIIPGQAMIAAGVNEEVSQKPATFSLEQNYPNPFNPSTLIAFSIPKADRVTLKVFNILGQEVATLVDRSLSPGEHSIVWNADKLPSGLYIYYLQTSTDQVARKMMLVK